MQLPSKELTDHDHFIYLGTFNHHQDTHSGQVDGFYEDRVGSDCMVTRYVLTLSDVHNPNYCLLTLNYC